MNKSFTLIEILVVIVVIGILSSFILVGISSIINSANIAKGKAFSDSLRNSLLMNLVSEWKFNGTGVSDGQSANLLYVNDSWGNNDGEVSGHEPDVRSENDCISGSCLQFTSTNSDYVNCGSISSESEGTITAWIKPSGTYTSGQVVMGGGNSAGEDNSARYTIGAIHSSVCSSNWYALIANGTSSQYVCSGEVYNETNFPANRWVLLTITYDGSSVKFYKNGNTANTVGQMVSAEGDSQPYAIGRSGGHDGLYYSGIIDDALIFSKATPTSQIQQIYYLGLNNLLKSNEITLNEFSQRLVDLKINLSGK